MLKISGGVDFLYICGQHRNGYIVSAMLATKGFESTLK
jgi:hypothetical protein